MKKPRFHIRLQINIHGGTAYFTCNIFSLDYFWSQYFFTSIISQKRQLSKYLYLVVIEPKDLNCLHKYLNNTTSMQLLLFVLTLNVRNLQIPNHLLSRTCNFWKWLKQHYSWTFKCVDFIVNPLYKSIWIFIWH